MDTDWNILGPDMLQFFGKMTSTTTHELNNAIGIINEHAGLLEDLGWMAKQKNQPDIDRWIHICKKITARVQRTHETIQNLNRFAHSIDHKNSNINPDTLLLIIISLSTRIMAQKNVIVELIPSKKSIEILTAPFLFLNLMDRCLMFARDHADHSRRVSINSHRDNGKYTITFSGIQVKDAGTFPGRIEQTLLNILDAKIKFQKNPNSLVIFMDTCK